MPYIQIKNNNKQDTLKHRKKHRTFSYVGRIFRLNEFLWLCIMARRQKSTLFSIQFSIPVPTPPPPPPPPTMSVPDLFSETKRSDGEPRTMQQQTQMSLLTLRTMLFC